MEKKDWTEPEVNDFDIAERTQLEGDPGDDGFDPAELPGGGGGGGGGGDS